MLKSEALEKGILWICGKQDENKLVNYPKFDINSKINLKSEIAYYWNTNYSNYFQKNIKPIFQKFKDKETKEFIGQEYLWSVGL